MRGQKNNVFLVEKRLGVIWFFFAWSFVFLVLGVAYRAKFAPEVLAVGAKKEAESLKTPLHDGSMEKTFWLDWIPQVQTLATGTVDEVTWGFEDAPFYVEALDERKAGWYMNCLLTCYMSTLTDFSSCRAITGVYNIRRLGYTTETREVSDANGDTRYRCAVTGMFVKGWRSPYGDTCSREEALEYYNKCSAQIDSAVAQVVAARSETGKPLSNVERLKYIHDWLIMNTDYAYEKQDLSIEDLYHIRNEYGTLVDREAVCRGYTYAFKALVDELARQTGADIECEEAMTRTHSWARVKLDGEWYNVDVTWDECNSSPDYVSGKYFLVSDEVISDDAHQNHSSVSSVKATNEQYEGKDWGKSL